MSDQEFIVHVLIHVRDALAVDARVGELGLEVVCEDDAVVVRGAVSSDECQAHVVAVVHQVLADHGCDRSVHDATYVPSMSAPVGEPEQL